MISTITSPTRRITLAVRDQIDGCRHRGQHETRVDVAPCQERQSRELREGLTRRVGVDRRRTGHAGVEREEEVERLGVADLTDDESIRPHAQRFFHEATECDLAGALQTRLPALQRDDIRRVDGQFERLLDGDDAVIGRTRGDQCAEQGGLPGVRRTRDQDAAATRHRMLQQPCSRRVDGADLHERVEIAVRGQELADVDRPVPPGDVGDHDVQSTAVRQGCVDEGLAQVDTPTRSVQHPFDEVAHRGIRQGERHTLGDTGAGDEDAVRSVDPQLFDGRILEIGLQGTVAGDGGEDLAHARGFVIDRGETAGESEVVVAAHLRTGDARRELRIARGIGPLRTQSIPHALGDDRRCGTGRRVGESHSSILASVRRPPAKLSTGCARSRGGAGWENASKGAP